MTSADHDVTDTSSLLIGPSIRTRDLLVDLGFEPMVADITDEQPGYRYDFGNLDLCAVQVTNEYLRPVMLFTGIQSTPRTLGMIEFELPMNVESFEQGLAILAYNVGHGFTPARSAPWLDLGRQLEEYLPNRREMQLFAQRPQCHVDAKWFRVAVGQLRAAGNASSADATFTASYRSGVLTLNLSGEVLPLPARGKNWFGTYSCRTQGLAGLSRRTPSIGVELSIWEGYLTIGRIRLPLTA